MEKFQRVKKLQGTCILISWTGILISWKYAKTHIMSFELFWLLKLKKKRSIFSSAVFEENVEVLS